MAQQAIVSMTLLLASAAAGGSALAAESETPPQPVQVRAILDCRTVGAQAEIGNLKRIRVRREQ